MPDKVVNLFDFSGGVINAKVNPLTFPEKAIYDGSNIDVVNQWVATRPGKESVLSADFTDGTVNVLQQHLFCTTEQAYLLAQVTTATTSKLYGSYTNLPSSAVSFTELYDFGSTAGTVTMARLNDRVIITEGTALRPLVFSGGMKTDGSDWAVPKQFIATTSGSAIYGSTFFDMTPELCDMSASSSVDLPLSTDLYLYICLDVRECSGLYFEVATANTAASTMSISRWNGSWTSVSGTDNTSTGGASLGKSGTATWTLAASEYRAIGMIPGFWWRIKLTFSAGLPSTPIRLSKIRYRAPVQVLQNIEECGQTSYPTVFAKVSSNNSYTDYATEVAISSTDVYANFNACPNTSKLYVGYLSRFCEIVSTGITESYNANASVATAEYWNGAAWTSLSTFVDGTISSGKTLAASGAMTWVAPTDWEECNTDFRPDLRCYWIRISFSSALSATVSINTIRLTAVPDTLDYYRLVIPYWDRVILADKRQAHDELSISRSLEEYGWTGEQAINIRAGGLERIVAAIEFYNEVWVSKAHRWFILNMETFQNLEMDMVQAGGQSPVNMQVCVKAPLDKYTRSNLEASEWLAMDQRGGYFLNLGGAWCFTGEKIFSLSQTVRWWETSGFLPRIDHDYLHLACGAYWPERGWIVWAVPMITTEGVSQTTNNRLIIYDIETGKWLPPFTIAASSISNVNLYSANISGNVGQNALYAGGYDGKIHRLFSSDVVEDDDVAIEGFLETGWFSFGEPQTEKLLRHLYLYGDTKGTMTLTVYRDGNDVADTGNVFTISQLDFDVAKMFSISFKHRNIKARFFKLRLDFTDVTNIYGIQMVLAPEREIPATTVDS